MRDEIELLYNAKEEELLQNELEYRNEIEEFYFETVTILKGNLKIPSRPLEPTTSGNSTNVDGISKEPITPIINFTLLFINETFTNFIIRVNNYFFLKIIIPETKLKC